MKFLKDIFLTAKDEVEVVPLPNDTEQTRSPSYRLAFSDWEFLLREELRPVRLQLELLKAEMIQREQQIEGTVAIFGSARIPERKKAQHQLKKAQQALAVDPNDKILQRNVKIARSILDKSHYYDEARELGRMIATESNQHEGYYPFVVITGGGPGLMEAANRGAHDVGAKNIGLKIVLPMEDAPNVYITPELSFQFHYFALRKMHFLLRAKAMVAFPGGFGTLDELFEALTLLQTKKVHPIPVLLFGREFWETIMDFDAMVDEGVISAADLDLFQYVETAREAWDIIRTFYQVN